MVCTDCFVPEFWLTSPPNPPGTPPGTDPPPLGGVYTMIGFIAGERTEELRYASPEIIAGRAVAQLDEIFGRVLHQGFRV